MDPCCIVADLKARDLAKLAEEEDKNLTAEARVQDARRAVLAKARDISPERAVAAVGGMLTGWLSDLGAEPAIDRKRV